MTDSIKKIAVIAPVEPFRSGIAKHSTQVARALSTQANTSVSVYSFNRLYPRFLFPGESDKDEGSEYCEVGAVFSLDTLNPLTWRTMVKRMVINEIDVAIFPAWTFFVAPCLGWIAKQCQKKGIKTLSIVHNAMDHEQGGWKNRLMSYQLTQHDGFICHNKELAEDVRTMVQNANIEITPHPIFDQYPASQISLPKRAKVELLFFGIIREYKGLDLLLQAIQSLKHKDIFLSVVGECWTDIKYFKDMAQTLGIANKVEFVDRYVSDSEAADYFARADAVALPYRSMTGTGVIPLAYHYGKPVITTNLSAFSDVVVDGETGFIADEVSSQALSKAINQFIEIRQQRDFDLDIAEYRKSFTWERFAQKVLTLGAMK